MQPSKSRRNTRSAKSSRSVQQHLRSLERAVQPQVFVGSTVGDPPAISNNGKFIDRVVNVTSNGVLTTGQISSALLASSSTGPKGDFFIRKIQIWGPGGVGDKISARFDTSALLASAYNSPSDYIAITDYGTGSRRAGIRCTIPLAQARLQQFDTAAGSAVAVDVTDAGAIHVSVRQRL